MSAWLRSCGGKSRYKSQAKAERYMAKSLAARPGQYLRVYACAMCAGWHMTSKRERFPNEAS